MVAQADILEVVMLDALFDVYDPLDPPLYKQPSLMSTFIVLQWSAAMCHKNDEVELAILTDARLAEMVIHHGNWPEC